MILRNFVVTGGLRRSNGDEAQVGDTVRLFKEDGADFLGVIQFPIAEVNCSNDRSYIIEYEGDMVRVCDLQDGGVVLDCCGLIQLEVDDFSEQLETLENQLNGTTFVTQLPLSENPEPTELTGTLYDRVRPFGPEDKTLWKAPINVGLAAWTAVFTSDGGSAAIDKGTITKSTGGNVELTAPYRLSVPYVTSIIKIVEPPQVNGPTCFTGFAKKATSKNQQIQTGSGAFDSEYLLCQYEFGSTTAEIVLFESNTSGFNERFRLEIDPITTSFELAACLQGKHISAWIKRENQDWEYAGGYETEIDYRDPEKMNLMAALIGIGNGTAAPIRISDFRVSTPLGTGAANASLLTYEDGSPIIVDGCFYFLANAPTFINDGSDVGKDIQSSQAAIWKYRHSSKELTRETIIFCKRGGKIYGENAGHIIFDRESSEWIGIMPTWGTYESPGGRVDMRMWRTKANILAGTHILESQEMNVTVWPNWDPTLIKRNGIWHLGYTRPVDQMTDPWTNGYRLALAKSTDLENWEDVVVSPGVPNSAEGLKPCWIGGKSYFSVSTTSAPRVYFMEVEDMSQVAWRTFADLDNSGPPSHFQIVPVANANQTSYIAIGMDKTRFRNVMYSWGNLTFYQLHEFAEGWDFIDQKLRP